MTLTHRWVGFAQYSAASTHHELEISIDAQTNPIVGRLIFQDGPIGDYGENGTTNEVVIQAIVERLVALNQPPFNCRENSLAITHLEEALHWLQARTAARQLRGVEGTATP